MMGYFKVNWWCLFLDFEILVCIEGLPFLLLGLLGLSLSLLVLCVHASVEPVCFVEEVPDSWESSECFGYVGPQEVPQPVAKEPAVAQSDSCEKHHF